MHDRAIVAYEKLHETFYEPMHAGWLSHLVVGQSVIVSSQSV